MNKVINGKRYDTETAHLCGCHDNGRMATDLDYYAESLYRKRGGEFFLFREGGPKSPLAKNAGNGSIVGGESIMPMTHEAAQAWAEEHLTGDEYSDIFGEPGEGETVAIGMSIRADLKAKLDRLARKTGKTRVAIIEELIEGA